MSLVLVYCNPPYYPSVSGTCLQIPAGFYRPTSFYNGVIYACPAGFYSTSGASSCIACANGYGSSPGASQCVGPCPDGTVVVNGLCTPVPVGKSAVNLISTTCPTALLPGGGNCPDMSGRESDEALIVRVFYHSSIEQTGYFQLHLPVVLAVQCLVAQMDMGHRRRSVVLIPSFWTLQATCLLPIAVILCGR